MRVNPINNFYRNSVTSQKKYTQNQVKPNANIVFKSVNMADYTPFEIGLAKKYRYVRYPYLIVLSEVDFDINKANRIEQLIDEYRRRNTERDNTISSLDTSLNQRNQQINKLSEEEQMLLKEVEQERILKAIDRLKLSKILTAEKRKQKVFSELDTKYISLYQLQEKKFPNAIMIKGVDNQDEQIAIIKYLQNKNCEVILLDFDKIPLETANKELLLSAKHAKNSGKHPIIYIQNFDKYTVPTDKNFNFINKLKGFLCACSKNYDTTILVFESNPERLDENIIGKHRFEKNIDVSNLKEDTFAFSPKFDGYTFIYDTDENSMVDLFLGDFGYNNRVLWAETTEPDKIKKVLEHIEDIKKLKGFSNIKYIQVPVSGIKNFHSTGKYTSDLREIYERPIQE